MVFRTTLALITPDCEQAGVRAASNWLIRYGLYWPISSSYSSFGLVRTHDPAGWGLNGVHSSVRRDLVGQTFGIPTGVCYWGNWRFRYNLG